MKTTVVIVLSTMLWALGLGVWLVIVPYYAQIDYIQTADYPTADEAYVFERAFANVSESGSLHMNIPFKILAGTPRNYDVTSQFDWLVTYSNEDVDRVVTMIYSYFSNGDYLYSIRQDAVGAMKGKFGGSYQPRTINKSETMRLGDNLLEIVLEINTATSHTPSTSSDFRLGISHSHVNVKASDSDGDGILDIVDPIQGLNNYIIVLALGIGGALSISDRTTDTQKKTEAQIDAIFSFITITKND
jgi:hypothetical protein